MTNVISKKTEKILLRILKYLEKEKDRLNMANWGKYWGNWSDVLGVNDQIQPKPPCKTTSCLGGTCLLVTKPGREILKDHGFFNDKNSGFPESFEHARNILDITNVQAERLFYFKEWSFTKNGWPEKYSKMYKDAETGKGRFKATKLRVMHFIKTGV